MREGWIKPINRRAFQTVSKGKNSFDINPLIFDSLSLWIHLNALMELYVNYSIALIIAVIAYIFRQPLMHMAHPASNELLMNYVGKKNQELISALSSSLWSASWFISAKIFERLRLLDYRYYEIFLITAGLYIVGNIFFALLIKEYESNKIVSSANSIPLKDEITMD